MSQKILKITTGNRVWLLDAEKIAQDYANYHGEIDGDVTVEETYDKAISDEDVLIDWLEWQMRWSDDFIIESYEDDIINDPFAFLDMCESAEIEYELIER